MKTVFLDVSVTDFVTHPDKRRNPRSLGWRVETIGLTRTFISHHSFQTPRRSIADHQHVLVRGMTLGLQGCVTHIQPIEGGQMWNTQSTSQKMLPIKHAKSVIVFKDKRWMVKNRRDPKVNNQSKRIHLVSFLTGFTRWERSLLIGGNCCNAALPCNITLSWL